MSGQSGPRIPPLPVSEFDDEARAALRAFLKGNAERFLSGEPDAMPLPNVLGMFMNHPGLAGPWFAFNDVLLSSPTLDPRLREIAILRVGWCTRSQYEWLQHVRMAKQLGLTDEQVEAIAGVAEGDPWTPLESAVLAATNQLLDGYRIDDATWARLAEHLDRRQLMELVFAVGAYTCLAMAFNSVGVDLDADLDDVVAPRVPE